MEADNTNTRNEFVKKAITYIKGTSNIVFIPSIFSLLMAVVIQNWGSFMNGDITTMVTDIKPFVDLVANYNAATLDTATQNFVTVFSQEVAVPNEVFDFSTVDCFRTCMALNKT